VIPFELVDAKSAADAVALLDARSHAQPIAAGGDLLGLLKEHVSGPTLRSPTVLVNLATARDMEGVAHEAGGLRLGAMTTLARLSAHPDVPPMLAEAVASIASPQLRVRTTIGGNLLQRPRCLYFRHPDVTCFKKGGTGCPAIGGPSEAYPGSLLPGTCHAGHPSDLAPALIALDAEAELLGPNGSRRLPLVELFDGAGTNAGQEALIGRAEVLTAILIPKLTCMQAFEKAAARNANEFSWACAAVAVGLDEQRVIGARVALGGISPAPLLWSDPRALMVGRQLRDVDPDAVVLDILPPSRMTDRHLERAAACWASIRNAISRIREGSPQSP
jgi:xanthine dehydrogenase YagS FAD-binding subunit